MDDALARNPDDVRCITLSCVLILVVMDDALAPNICPPIK